MISAFGVEHTFSKADSDRDKRRNIQGTALAGAGAVTGGTALVAGGIPGAKSDFTSVFRMKPGKGKGVKRVASTIKGAAPAAKATPGGILGFRVHAHQGGTAGFEQEAVARAAKKTRTARQAWDKGENAGKIAPEYEVLRGMVRGRKVSNALLAAGAGTAAYGLHRRKPKDSVSKSRAERRSDTYNAALVGTGGTATALTVGVPKYLDKHKRRYERSASAKVDEAGRLIPALAGRHKAKISDRQAYKLIRAGKPHPLTMYPKVSINPKKADPKQLRGVPKKTVERAGELRGAARQERHFAEVFRNTSKVVRMGRGPAAATAAAGAGGLYVNRRDKKKP